MSNEGLHSDDPMVRAQARFAASKDQRTLRMEQDGYQPVAQKKSILKRILSNEKNEEGHPVLFASLMTLLLIGLGLFFFYPLP